MAICIKYSTLCFCRRENAAKKMPLACEVSVFLIGRLPIYILATIQNPEKLLDNEITAYRIFLNISFTPDSAQVYSCPKMCRVSPKIATVEVQNRETATCRDLLLLLLDPHAHHAGRWRADLSNHARC